MKTVRCLLTGQTLPQRAPSVVKRTKCSSIGRQPIVNVALYLSIRFASDLFHHTPDDVSETDVYDFREIRDERLFLMHHRAARL